MDIDLKCGADIRMTQHLAQALYIYPTLHTAGGVCVPQRVKISVRDTRCFQQSPVLILHCPWLHRHIFPSQEIVFAVGMGLDQLLQKGGHVPRQRDSTPGAVTFGRQHHQTGAVPTADALYGFADMDYPIPQVNILILQGAQPPRRKPVFSVSKMPIPVVVGSSMIISANRWISSG